VQKVQNQNQIGWEAELGSFGSCPTGREILKAMPVERNGSQSSRGVWQICILLFGISWAGSSWSQSAILPPPNSVSPSERNTTPVATSTGFGETNADFSGEPAKLNTLSQWEGLTVRSISFAGIEPGRLNPQDFHLPQSAGAPLNREAIRKSLRQLFATGIFERES